MPQVSQRLDLPGKIKALPRWTSRLRFIRAAQNVMYRIWAKHIIYMSAFVLDCTHLVCHDQNLRTFIRLRAPGGRRSVATNPSVGQFKQNHFQGIAVLRQTAPPFSDKFSVAPGMADHHNKTSSSGAQSSLASV